MKAKIKNYSLVLCLFVFLFVLVGGGFHLSPNGAFVAALSGTPIVIFGFNRWCSTRVARTNGSQERPAHVTTERFWE